MRFSHKDKKDERVSSQSTYAFDFPDKLNQAPLGLGVFVLLNEASDVLYVGCAVKSGFEVALSELKDKNAARDVVSYRWFMIIVFDSFRLISAGMYILLFSSALFVVGSSALVVAV